MKLTKEYLAEQYRSNEADDGSTTPMKARVLRTKLFLASTLSSIEREFQNFLEEQNICVGNYIDIKLFRLGNIYQLIFVYAKVIDD